MILGLTQRPHSDRADLSDYSSYQRLLDRYETEMLPGRRQAIDVAVEQLRERPTEREWKGSFLEELRQARLWDDRKASNEPPRKVPFKFQYVFDCDDPRCKRHRMMNEDWELGALF